MPDGVLQWYDPATGEGRVLHAGRRFSVRAAQMEPAARTPGARVRFDVDRRTGDAAVQVRLRRRIGASSRQRHLGDLAGADAPDPRGAAPFATAHPGLGRDLQRHPTHVAGQWSALMAAGQVDQAARLYAPDAALHAEGDVVVGRAGIRRYLASCPVVGELPAIRGENDTVVVHWSPVGVEAATVESRLRMAHGEIVEQWIGEIETAPSARPGEVPIKVSTSGEITRVERETAVAKISHVVKAIDRRVRQAGIRLDCSADPARDRPARARVTLDLDGEMVRARVTGHTMGEAVELLDARLRRRLEHLAAHRRALRRRGPGSGRSEWRHGDPPTARPRVHPRPVDEREVVRRKAYLAIPATVDEAAFDLEAADQDFFLFTDLATGQDALVERRGGGTYRLQYLAGPAAGEPPPCAAAVDIDPRPAPHLSLHGARERLDACDEPFVFHADARTGRGHVLYRRDDGHYGLITPADEVALTATAR